MLSSLTVFLFEDSINARALDHQTAMVDAYTKTKPDSFNSPLPAVVTTYYVDINGVPGASGCPKTKLVKRRFEDQEDADEDAGNEGAAVAAADAAAAALAEAAPAGGEAPAAPAPAPSPGGKAGERSAKKNKAS
jgi:hypothetical protein